MFGVNRTLAAIAAILLGIGTLWIVAEATVSSIRRQAAAARDVVWERKLREAQVQHESDKKALQASIDEAAAKARAEGAIDLIDATTRAVELQSELDALKADLTLPKSLIRELRR